MAGCSPARDETASYTAYGHSIVTDPWGRILEELDEKEGILDIELDLAETDRIRTQIPLGQ
jgi:predicted amidohydrolase